MAPTLDSNFELNCDCNCCSPCITSPLASYPLPPPASPLWSMPLCLLSLAQCCKIYRVTYETNSLDTRFLSHSHSLPLTLSHSLSLLHSLCICLCSLICPDWCRRLCFGRVILSLRFTTHKNASDFILYTYKNAPSIVTVFFAYPVKWELRRSGYDI